MSTPVLATKLYIPRLRSALVARPQLMERLHSGHARAVTLVSAPAGFGKTTLISAWVAELQRPVAWLSLDPADSDPLRFLRYLIAAVQSVAPAIGHGALAAVDSPQSPPVDAILTALLNELAGFAAPMILVLDDYHAVDGRPVHDALCFLVEHLPAHLNLVISTREDPPLPLSRLRVRDQLTEIRAADLRFTPAEAAAFLTEIMGLELAPGEIHALERRTEGWIAGLQLAALSLQGRTDPSAFIGTFAGSNRFVLDYLVEEVLNRRPPAEQEFLLRTSILQRLSGSLCDAVLECSRGTGQGVLESLEQANLFVVPLDDERLWYRYHHLFGGFLRRRLEQEITAAPAAGLIPTLHRRAADWYDAHGLDLEAFHHAVAAGDIDHAARLVEGEGMPLIFRGAAVPVLDWLAMLPPAELDARPALWVIYGSALLFVSRPLEVEEKLAAAETALEGAEANDATRDLLGHIAAIRATLAVLVNDVESIVAQSRRALAYLDPGNLPVRTATTWTLGIAYQLHGERAAAEEAFAEAATISEAIGHYIIQIAASIGLGNIQEVQNRLPDAADTYRHVIQVAGEPPPVIVSEAHFGLARCLLEWNDPEGAQRHIDLAADLARPTGVTDRSLAYELFGARLEHVRGDLDGAHHTLARVKAMAAEHQYGHVLAAAAAAECLICLQKNDPDCAARAIAGFELPVSLARVKLAGRESVAALALLEPLGRELDGKQWRDERLKVLVLQASAYAAAGDQETAVRLVLDALGQAEPAGFVRLFVDEGEPMRRLIDVVARHSQYLDYTTKLLAAFDRDLVRRDASKSDTAPVIQATGSPSPVDALTARELDILRLVAAGYSNRAIGEELFLALDTVKGHNRRIFAKLQVRRRTAAVARARALGIL